MSDPKTLDAAALDDIDARMKCTGVMSDITIDRDRLRSLLDMARRSLALEDACKSALGWLVDLNPATQAVPNAAKVLHRAMRTDHE